MKKAPCMVVTPTKIGPAIDTLVLDRCLIDVDPMDFAILMDDPISWQDQVSKPVDWFK